MRSSELIRSADDIELPAVGRWHVPRGQRLDGPRPRLRSRPAEIRTDGGLLLSSSGSPSLALSLTVMRAAGDAPPERWTFSGRAGQDHRPTGTVSRAC